jgi:mannose-1-phosphate guanylyltransferase
MALWEVEDPTEFGIVGLSSDAQGEVDGNLRSGFIRRFLEKPTREEAFSNVINAGLYILEPEVFEHIPEGEKFDFSKQLFPHLLTLGWPMYAQAIDGVWFDVGQPSELLRAQETLIRDYDRLPFTYPPSYHLSDGNLLAESASLRGRVNSSVVGPTCQLGEGSEVRDSLIMEGCSIAASAKINQSILGRNVSVPEGVMVEDCVIGDGVQLEPASIYSNQRISQFD